MIAGNATDLGLIVRSERRSQRMPQTRLCALAGVSRRWLSDFESGKAQLPGGVPFEPEWVMQALGMTRFPLENQYRVEVDQRARVYKLTWPAKTPGTQEYLSVKPHTVKDPQLRAPRQASSSRR